MRLLTTSILAFLLSIATLAQHTVNSTGDAPDDTLDGVCQTASLTPECTLRAALEEAASGLGSLEIEFDIPKFGAGCVGSVCSIKPATPLPPITEPFTSIDGTTQSGASCGEITDGTGHDLKIFLDGSDQFGPAGIVVENVSASVEGLIIGNFDYYAILVQGGNHERNISCNYLGIDHDGEDAIPNGRSGIHLENTTGDVRIFNNLISGNDDYGISTGVDAAATASVWIYGNLIGSTADGANAAPNGAGGIQLFGSRNKNIGIEPDLDSNGNVISGNNGPGITGGSTGGTKFNTISNNYIGADLTGAAALGNAGNGITFWTGHDDNTITNNVIGANGGHGIRLNGTDNTVVLGNYIGTSPVESEFGNGGNGIQIDANSHDHTIGQVGHGNVIRWNFGYGIVVESGSDAAKYPSGISIRGNSIFENTFPAIDLGADNVTPNDDDDPDSGANGLQNAGLVLSAEAKTAAVMAKAADYSIEIDYLVDSDPANSAYPLTVDFYSTVDAASARTYLGSDIYTAADFTGVIKTITLTVPEELFGSTDSIANIVTDADGNSSEAFRASSEISLPIELATFEAVQANDQIILNWTTAQEIDNSGFEIEHLDAGADSWQTLGFVTGAGTTEEGQAYSFSVESANPGRHSFRLRQVDFDGTATISPIVEVSVALAEAFFVSAAYPNPTTGVSSVRMAVAKDEPVAVELFNLLGQPVKRFPTMNMTAGETRTVQVDGSELPAGAYFVRLTSDSGRRTISLTVTR